MTVGDLTTTVGLETNPGEDVVTVLVVVVVTPPGLVDLTVFVTLNPPPARLIINRLLCFYISMQQEFAKKRSRLSNCQKKLTRT